VYPKSINQAFWNGYGKIAWDKIKFERDKAMEEEIES
jgi:hypothetical protein